MPSKILAVDDNLINLKVVNATLTHAGYAVDTASSGADALEKMNQSSYDLVILDITMPEMDGYEVCRRMRANPATVSTPVMMLTAHDSLEEKLKGFEAGADEYLTKPFQPAELTARVKVLIRRAPAEAPRPVTLRGRLIGVFSLRGGIGVSTVAVNLAAGLAQLWPTPVGLVDLAFTSGQAALMLNLPLRNTWSDLAKIAPDELDEDLIRRVLLEHKSGLKVLSAPRSPIEAESIQPVSVVRVLDFFVSQFGHVVLDLPHDLSESTLSAMERTDDLILLMSPELASVRATVGILEVLDQINYPRNQVHIILNWTFEKRGLARKDIENVIKHPIELVLPFAPDVFVPALNLGTPPVVDAPTSPVGMFFEELAWKYSGEDALQKKPAEPKEAWNRVNERIQQRQSGKR